MNISKKKNIVAIIQARIGSSRLRAKILKEVAPDIPLIKLVVDRAKATKLVDSVVVATTKQEEDDTLVDWCINNDVSVFRGDENNVLNRYFECACTFDADIILRITADDPFKDPDVNNKAIELLLENAYDYVSNTLTPSYPEGVDIEVFTYEALKTANKNAVLKSEKEHVTPYICNNKSNKFNTYNFLYNKDLSFMRWTIDYQEDLEFVQEICKHLDISKNFSMEDILSITSMYPEIAAMENKVVRMEGYLKSVSEEKMIRVGELEKKYVLDVLDSQFSTSSGAKYMTKFENAFKNKFESEFAISHVNGTATMHSVLEAAGIGIGDEVIVPPLTMAATSLAVLHANATPVFADVEIDSFNIDPRSIEENITDKTKAIITVALFGLSPDMDPIMQIAKKHNLIVIEDNAEAFLSYYKGRLVGTIGHAASFSFQSSKHLSTGEGGITITNDENLALGIRKVSGLGYKSIGPKQAKIKKDDIQHPAFERHDYIGWNYRMNELSCAVALAQIERADELIGLRKQIGGFYEDAASGFDWFKPQYIGEGYVSSYWAFACHLDTNNVSWDDFRKEFLRRGGDRYYGAWKPTYMEPLFQKKMYRQRTSLVQREYEQGLCPNAEFLQSRMKAFKTNYMDLSEAKQQAEVLNDTLNFFD